MLTALGAGAMTVAACAEDSEAARLVRESGGGVRISASDDAALVDVIARVRGGAIDTAACRAAARAYALRTFDRDTVYGAIVRELVRRPAPVGHVEAMTT
jgi:hypothetical protein